VRSPIRKDMDGELELQVLLRFQIWSGLIP
jgi:hypothetical protein